MITDEKMKEFESVCKPVVEWLQKDRKPILYLWIIDTLTISQNKLNSWIKTLDQIDQDKILIIR